MVIRGRQLAGTLARIGLAFSIIVTMALAQPPIPAPPDRDASPAPPPEAGPVDVAEDQELAVSYDVRAVMANTDLELQRALNDSSVSGWALVTVVPLGDAESLLVWQQQEPQAQVLTYTVIPVNELLEESQVKARLETQPTKTLLGIHRVDSTMYMMVFRDGQ